MVEHMKPGAVIIDVAIDQGGCFETSRPTTLADPTFVHNGVLHYCVPNMTADMGRSTSMALAQALLPYLLNIAHAGLDEALRGLPELGRGIYTHRGVCVQRALADALGLPFRPLSEMLPEAAPGGF
jgi:alanine dehydrogenase